MKKVVAREIAVIIVALVIVLALVFYAQGASVAAYHQAIHWNNSSRSIVFDLEPGQSVSGSVTYTGDTVGGWFLLHDPNGAPIVTSPTDYDFNGDCVDFTFMATMEGQYYGSVHSENPFCDYIDYSYSITSPTILGIDVSLLVAVIVAVGVVLAVLIAVLNFRTVPKKSKWPSNL